MATCLFAQDFIASGYSLVIGQSLATAFIMILLVGQFASCAGLDLWVAAAGREKKREGGGGEVRGRRGQVGGGGRGGSTCRVSVFCEITVHFSLKSSVLQIFFGYKKMHATTR